MSKNYFECIVKNFGDKQDYFQGAGGNISLKLQDQTMLIKASGKKVVHMGEYGGYVALSFNQIKEHFFNNEPYEEGDKESNDLILSLVLDKTLGRPSIETGFHALLGTAVIHSHSVYVNLLTCSSSFEQLVDTIFFGSKVRYLCLSYTAPGYFLTHLFLEKVRKLSLLPRIIFMKNHGIVVSAPTLEEAIEMHEFVNNEIRRYFGISNEKYPRGSLVHLENDVVSKSATPFLQKFVRENITYFKDIDNHILFPDLTVFCSDLLVDSTFRAKVEIRGSTGEIMYHTNNKEAHCIEENLIAYAYLLTVMKKHYLRPVFISNDDAEKIKGMEQEKYRKALLENGS